MKQALTLLARRAMYATLQLISEPKSIKIPTGVEGRGRLPAWMLWLSSAKK